MNDYNAGILYTAPFTLGDLYSQPVPMSVYSSQPWCGQWAYSHSSILWADNDRIISMLGWECPTTRPYAPILIVPASVYASLDPAWATCNADLRGVYGEITAGWQDEQGQTLTFQRPAQSAITRHYRRNCHHVGASHSRSGPCSGFIWGDSDAYCHFDFAGRRNSRSWSSFGCRPTVQRSHYTCWDHEDRFDPGDTYTVLDGGRSLARI